MRSFHKRPQILWETTGRRELSHRGEEVFAKTIPRRDLAEGRMRGLLQQPVQKPRLDGRLGLAQIRREVLDELRDRPNHVRRYGHAAAGERVNEMLGHAGRGNDQNDLAVPPFADRGLDRLQNEVCLPGSGWTCEQHACRCLGILATRGESPVEGLGAVYLLDALGPLAP